MVLRPPLQLVHLNLDHIKKVKVKKLGDLYIHFNGLTFLLKKKNIHSIINNKIN